MPVVPLSDQDVNLICRALDLVAWERCVSAAERAPYEELRDRVARTVAAQSLDNLRRLGKGQR